MSNDFLIALLVCLLILFLFWTITLLFIFYRRYANSKLTIKLVIKSNLIFLIGFIILIVLIFSDSF